MESALQSRKKMKNKSIDLGRLYRVRELAEICGVNYLTALNLVKLGESDSVKIGRTYLVTGERIQDRLTQKFMLYLLSFVVVSRRKLETLLNPASRI